jgi:hypothetical protein
MHWPFEVAMAVLLASLSGCDWRPYTLECEGPDQGVFAEECATVADAVMARIDLSRSQIGELLVVSVATIDCEQAGRPRVMPELYAPEIDGCWQVQLTFDGGVLHRLVGFNRETGEFLILE